MITTIFKFEWKQLIRSKALLLAMLIFTAIGLFCLQQGDAVYSFQRIAVDSAMAQKQRSYQSVKQFFDTLKPSADGSLQEMQEPYSLERRLQDVVVRDLSPLAVLSVGQSDVYPPLMSGHFSGNVFKNQFAEFQNPEKLLAGNLDASFFLLFLFPLLFIALSYNARSADDEAGISSLLITQAGSINRIVQYRVLFRWIMAMLPVTVILLTSFIMLSGRENFSIKAWAQWWLVGLLYTAFWLLVVLWIQRLGLNSVINAMTLAGIWVLLLIAIPGFLNTSLNYRYPAANKIEAAEYRDLDFKLWDLPFETHQAFVYQRFSSVRQIPLKTYVDTIKLRSFSYSLQTIEHERQLYNQAVAKKQRRASAEQQLLWINPVGGVMRAFAHISGSSLQQQTVFEHAALAYRERKLKYLFEKLMVQQQFLKADFEGIPVYKAPAGGRSVFYFLIPLILVSGLILASLLLRRS